MLTVVVFILILGLLVLVHEVGHFVSAIKLGVAVEEFGIGFPPKMFSVKIKGIEYSLNWIPIGGFVKIKGENDDNEDSDSFYHQPAWKKTIILVAGVFMNFLLSAVLLTIAFANGLPQALDNTMDNSQITERQIVVIDVVEGSPANQAGIEIGDSIVSINGVQVSNSDELYNTIDTYQDGELEVKYVKNNEEQVVKMNAVLLDDSGDPMIGIGAVDVGIVRYGFFNSIWQGIKMTGVLTWTILKAFYYLILGLITQGKLIAEISGPVGVAALTGKFVKMGWVYVLQFAALLSINLGIINILPFPALDGGRLLFVGIEKIRGKQINDKIANIIHNSGFILLILLLVVVTFRDVVRYSGTLLDTIKNIF